ncbi:MAG: WD40/YVTN/BNR-like repeat-containing protein [Candidatus Aminicenantia bacterium]
MKKFTIILFVLLISVTFLLAQDKLQVKAQETKYSTTEKPTDPITRLESFEHHFALKNNSLFKNLKWRSVGPQVQGGRIVDLAIPKGNHFIIYAATASGGLWKTENNGTTWEPIFDNESSITIGDIAVADSDLNIIWVGTGENNSSRSSYSGTGVFKSTDGGKTWQNMGLTDTHHIGRIVIHPENPDIVYVAAIGHLYTDNEERGVFKTPDGGKNWEKILYISDKVGAIDLVMDPSDSNTLYAAAWERSRKAWNFVEGGEESRIYKTTDGGKTWKQLTNGLPAGENVGRIGLAIAPSNPNVIYALIDNQAKRPEEKPEKKKEKETSGITLEQLEKMTSEEFLKLDPKRIQLFLKENNVPKEYSAEMIIDLVRKGQLDPPTIAQYLLDANRRLFETNIIGAEVYRSDDGGETWRKMNEKYIDNFCYTYGYYFGNIRVSPDNENQIYILGVPLLTSNDGGKTFQSIGGRGVHADHHALWIDPKNPDRLIDGNDGGLNFSYDRGKTWQKINNLPIGQFYTITVDMEKPYNIYGGLQDNGVMYGPSNSIPGVTDPWKTIYGGDGAYVQIDSTDSNIVYAESQFGNISRINKKDGTKKNIKPKAKIGETPLRYNWQTPFLISHHNPFILYYGANKLFKSLDRGDHWWPISDDLTTNLQPQGDVPYSTITTISESPIRPGLLYAGTDDGNLWVTKNDGATWEKINQGLPKRWVSRVEASRFDEGTVYVSFTGYRNDDFEKYLFKSTDYGKTWVSVANNLPSEPINVIREDPKNKNILYVGTDLGVYITIDGGQTWHSLCNNLPTIAVHDLIVHPRDNDLVIGTHGRSVYVMNIENIQKFDEKIQAKDVYLFDIKPVKLRRYRYAPQPQAEIYYYLKESQKIRISILDDSGKVIRRLEGTNDPGFNLAIWDLRVEDKGERKQYVKPGTYTVELAAEKIKIKKKIEVQLSKN